MSHGQAVAIVGMACRFPGARDVPEFWRNLRAGVESIRFFTDDELAAAGVDERTRRDPRYVPASGALEDVDRFDAAFFGFTPREAEITDPQQRVFLECAWEAMEAGGYRPGREAGRVGVFAGAGVSTYLLNNLLHRPDVLASTGDLELLMANNKDYVPTRVAYKLDLTGPAVNANTACSTGLVNVHLACQSLLAFECDMALAGGISIQVPQDRGYLYQPDGILSPDGHCRAFDASAAGTVSGNGAGIVLLKRLDEAIAARDHIHAVIVGTAMNNDGAGKAGFTAPSVSGQADVIAQALAMAGVPADTIGYVEAHGTGTPVGDPIEIAALARAFGARTPKIGFCAIGSVKSNLGHTDEAAGVAGLIKAALAVEHGEIPPSLHVETPNPALQLETTPFYVNGELRSWPLPAQPRRAGVSSFGLGGTNVHMVIEQAPASPPSPSPRPQLLALSARSAAALDAASARLATALERSPETCLADAAFTLLAGRRRFPHRRVVIAGDRHDAVRVLRGGAPERVIEDRDEETRARDVVFMFSGHGAHYAGMARGVYDAEPVFRASLDRSAQILRPHTHLDIREAIFGDDESMRGMAVAQPALFALQYALAELWMSWGITPAAMIGHSAGEYVAACLAGTFALEDALGLIAARGRLMGEMAPGTMLAVALSEEDLGRRLGGRLDIAVAASPGMSVVSGRREDVDAFRIRAEADGIDCRSLNIDVAGHSALMDPALSGLRAAAAGTAMQPPRVPFVSNVTGTWITDRDATSADYWASHLRATVRFGDGIAALAARFPRACFLEIGPGRSLQSPVLRHPARQSDQPVFATLRHAADLIEDEAFLLGTLGRLWAAGVDVDAAKVFAGEGRRRVPLPAYPFERKRYWIVPGAAAPAAPLSGKRPNVDEWIYLPSWKRAQAPSPHDSSTPRRFAIIGGDMPLATAVAARLRQDGHALVEWSAGVPSSPEPVDEIVDFRGCGEPERGPEPSSLLGSLVSTAQAVVRRHDAAPLIVTVVSRGVHDVTGSEPLDPDRAVLLGGVQAIEQEFPHVRCRSIDVDVESDEHAVAERVIAELRGFAPDRLIALRGRHRWVRDYEAQPAAATPAPRLRERGVYLITGGAGDVGLTIAEFLARTVRARIVLTSRSRRPHAARVHAIEAAGGEAIVMHADVADETAMREALDETARRFGSIDGVFHAAGVTSPDILLRSVPETSPDQIQTLFAPKVDGTRVLERLLHGRAIDFCVLISSNASTLGGLGLCAYSGASHFLDAFAAVCRRRGLPWTSTNWDGWPSTVEPSEGARTHIETYTMTRAEAESALLRVLALDTDRVVVSSGDLAARLDRWQRPDRRPGTTAATSGDGLGETRDEHLGRAVPPVTDSERAIAEIFEELLGVRPVGRHDSFFELGGDSLLGSRVMARLGPRLGVELSIKALFAGPTVALLAARAEEASAFRLLPSALTLLQPIPRLPDQPSYATSHAQRRLWILQQIDPGSAAYHVPLHQRLDGLLDRAALEHALGALVRRHESLRTTFITAGGEPRQVVHAAAPDFIAIHDVSREADPDAAARELARQQTLEPFNLENGPLIRAAIVRLAEARHALLVTVHHIVADGVSIAAIASDLAALYEAACDGKAAALPPLGIQYRDFAAWQSARLDGERGREHRDYWHTQLAGELPVLNLLEDLPRPPVLTSRGHELMFEIPAEVTRALTELGRRRGASLFMVLTAGVNALLHRCTGDEEIIVGSPSAGRRHVDVDGQVGFFLNTIALRTRIDAGQTFETLLDQVRETAVAAYEHEEYPFERLVHELQLARDTSRSPIFDVMVILQNDVAGTRPFGALTARPFTEHTGTSRLDLSFNFKSAGGALLLGLEYNTDVLREDRVRSLGEELQILLQAVVAQPSTAIGRLPLLSAAERHRVLVEFNATARAYPSDHALVDLFEARGRLTPDAPAVRHRERTTSYRDLDILSNRLARHFADRAGFGAGHTAVLCAPSNVEMLASLLAILKLRGAAVLAEPSVPPARLEAMLAGSRCRLLVTGVTPDAISFDGTVVELERDGDAVERRSGDAISADGRRADDTALIFFTSGSTGRPNAVPLSNRAIVNELDWYARYFAVTARDVIPQKTVLTFVDCIVELLLPITIGGGCVHLRPAHETARDFVGLSHWFRSIRPTILQFVPVVFEEFVADGDTGALDGLRALVLSGGAAIRQPRYPFRVYNLYGCSECTALSTAFDMTEPAPLARVPIGKPLQNTTIYVLDPTMEPCPIFVPGEIYVGGDMVAAGYLGEPALTSERFVDSPFKTGERLFRTGDFGRWCADGNLDYLGRRDDQVKVRGLRIECAEVEHALRAYEGVREAIVAGRRPGGGDAILTAYFTVMPRGAVDADGLRQHLAGSLPDYMIPTAFVRLDEFPRTSSGKINRRALPDPDPAPALADVPPVPPRDDTERAIAGIWCEVLGLESAGVHDDFLRLGGHSLKAARVVARMHRELAMNVALVDLFRHPTIAAIATLVRGRAPVTYEGIRRVDDGEAVAPLTAEELELLGD